MFPGEEDASLALMQPSAIESVPSQQRLGPDGYPLIGAYPKAAAEQLKPEKADSERQRLSEIAKARNHPDSPLADYRNSLRNAANTRQEQKQAVRSVGGGKAVADYNRAVSDLVRLRKKQREEAAAAFENSSDAEASTDAQAAPAQNDAAAKTD